MLPSLACESLFLHIFKIYASHTEVRWHLTAEVSVDLISKTYVHVLCGVCACVWRTHMCVSACGARGRHQMSDHSLLLLWRQNFSLNLELMTSERLTNLHVRELLCLCLPSVELTGMYCWPQLWLYVCWRPELRSSCFLH